MPNIKNNVAAQETRRKLMEAAGRVFAAHGLHAATIKQITDAAGVNMAAVNYHFRDKFELYEAIVLEAFNEAIAPMAKVVLPDGPPAARLEAFVETFLRHLLAPNRPEWQKAIISRETTHPVSRLGDAIRDGIRQNTRQLRRIFQDLLGPEVSENMMAMAVCGTIGQCLFFIDHRPMIEHIFPQATVVDDIPALAKGIVAIVLRGVAATNRDAQEAMRTGGSEKRGTSRESGTAAEKRRA